MDPFVHEAADARKTEPRPQPVDRTREQMVHQKVDGPKPGPVPARRVLHKRQRRKHRRLAMRAQDRRVRMQRHGRDLQRIARNAPAEKHPRQRQHRASRPVIRDHGLVHRLDHLGNATRQHRIAEVRMPQQLLTDERVVPLRRADRREVEPERARAFLIDRRRKDDDLVSSLAQRGGDRERRLDFAERAESTKDDAKRSHTVGLRASGAPRSRL